MFGGLLASFHARALTNRTYPGVEPFGWTAETTHRWTVTAENFADPGTLTALGYCR